MTKSTHHWEMRHHWYKQTLFSDCWIIGTRRSKKKAMRRLRSQGVKLANAAELLKNP